MTDSDLGDGHCLSPLSVCVGAWVRVCMGAWVRGRVAVCERRVGKGGIEGFWSCHNEIYLTPSSTAQYCSNDPSLVVSSVQLPRYTLLGRHYPSSHPLPLKTIWPRQKSSQLHPTLATNNGGNLYSQKLILKCYLKHFYLIHRHVHFQNYCGIVQLIISSIIGILLRILIAHTRIQVNV